VIPAKTRSTGISRLVRPAKNYVTARLAAAKASAVTRDLVQRHSHRRLKPEARAKM